MSDFQRKKSDFSNHPEVEGQTKTESEVLREFLEGFGDPESDLVIE